MANKFSEMMMTEEELANKVLGEFLEMFIEAVHNEVKRIGKEDFMRQYSELKQSKMVDLH